MKHTIETQKGVDFPLAELDTGFVGILTYVPDWDNAEVVGNVVFCAIDRHGEKEYVFLSTAETANADNVEEYRCRALRDDEVLKIFNN